MATVTVVCAAQGGGQTTLTLLASPRHLPVCAVPGHVQTAPAGSSCALPPCTPQLGGSFSNAAGGDSGGVTLRQRGALQSLCPGLDARTSAFVLCLLFETFWFYLLTFFSIHVTKTSKRAPGCTSRDLLTTLLLLPRCERLSSVDFGF